MVQLIIGGSGSGKSAYAEQEAVRLHQGKTGRLLYLATMEVFDEESRERIKRHRAMRQGKAFTTIECQTHLERVLAEGEDTVLLECLSNLAANEMYAPNGRGEKAAEVIIKGIRCLAVQAGNLLLVGNNVHSDGCPYDASTRSYIRRLAEIQREAAALSDCVTEVVHGIPLLCGGTAAKGPRKDQGFQNQISDPEFTGTPEKEGL